MIGHIPIGPLMSIPGSGGGTPELLDIAVAAHSPTHAATVNTANALAAFGHTVHIYASSSLSSTYAPYDVIVAARAQYFSSTVSSRIIGAGKPVVWGLDSGVSVGTPDDSNPSEEDLFPLVFIGNGTANAVNIIDNTHPITSPFATGALAVTPSNTFSFVASTGGTVGDVLAHGDPDDANLDGKAALVAIESGTLDLAGNATSVRHVVNGFCYGAAGYTTDGADLLERCVRWAVGAL